MTLIKHLNPTNERFSFREMEHVAVNYAISCMKGYNGSFRDYYFGIKSDWRKCLRNEDKRRVITINDK